ncbi:MAG: hypothetical protein ACREH6_13180 [Geminicoccaceae bacterium]
MVIALSCYLRSRVPAFEPELRNMRHERTDCESRIMGGLPQIPERAGRHLGRLTRTRFARITDEDQRTQGRLK